MHALCDGEIKLYTVHTSECLKISVYVCGRVFVCVTIIMIIVV